MRYKNYFPLFLLSLLWLPFGLSGCAQTELAAHWVKKTITIDEEDHVTYSGKTRSNATTTYSDVSSTYGTQGNFKVGKPYKILGVWYTPKESYSLDETGIASWYGPNFHGKKTANGEIYDQYAMTAAHRTLQMPSLVRVTNLENGRSIVVRINDRGPFAHGRIIDMSKRGAELLGFKNQGTARVRVQVLANESRQLAAAAKSGEPVRIAMKTPATQAGHAQRSLTSQRTMSDTSQTSPPVMPPAVTQKRLEPIGQTDVAGHYEQGRFMPDSVVSQENISTDNNLYIQVGSFTVIDNAEAVRERLNDLATVVIAQAFVNGRTFNRVRLGPLASVDEADQVLETTISRGFSGAQIIVD